MGSVLAAANQKIGERDSEIEQLETQLADLKQNSAPVSEFPDAADLLNQLRARMKVNRKKSTASPADVEKILEILLEIRGGGQDD